MFWRPAFTGGGGGVGPPGPPGPAGTALRAFTYAAVGTALTTGDFVIPIPAPVLADINFIALVGGAGLSFDLNFDVIQADSTTASIHVIASAKLTAGDIVFVSLQENT
jgi:hypothetical protein